MGLYLLPDYYLSNRYFVEVVNSSTCVLIAIKTQSNLRLVQKLLDSMLQALERGEYEHVGSQQLWTSHCMTVNKLQSRLDSLHIAEVCLLCLLLLLSSLSSRRAFCGLNIEDRVVL